MYRYLRSKDSFTLILRRTAGILFMVVSLSLPACESFLDVGVPRTQLVSATAFDNETTARAAVLAIYAEMMSEQQGFASGGFMSVSLLAGLSADELELSDSVEVQRRDFQTNSLLGTNDIVENSIWAQSYKCIYYANGVVEGLSISTKLEPEVKGPLEGEAKFLRAFIYFYLTNLYGDVPLILSTDSEVNNSIGKVSSEEVYKQIVSDLEDAQRQLPVHFETDDAYGRVRAGKYAAMALLARVYLYLGDWARAEATATTVIGFKDFELEAITEVFVAKDNSEAIWQLMPAYEGRNSYEALAFLLGTTLTKDLVRTFGKETSFDLRQVIWMADGGDSTFLPIKYKATMFDEVVEEYSVVLRLAEQYLIRAEARAQQGGALLTQAAEDLNAVRGRAGLLPVAVTSTQPELLEAIALERRKELFSEWGHRWLDLKRTGRANIVLSKFKGSSWQPTDVLYPLPSSEIVKNPNIGPQNQGY